MSNPTEDFDPADLATISQDHHLKMGEALQRLYKNEDFKTVIQEGYLEQKVLASVSLLGVPQEHGRRPSIVEDLISASNLQFFFSQVDNFYQGALNPILSDEEEAALAEEEAAEGSTH